MRSYPLTYQASCHCRLHVHIFEASDYVGKLFVRKCGSIEMQYAYAGVVGPTTGKMRAPIRPTFPSRSTPAQLGRFS